MSGFCRKVTSPQGNKNRWRNKSTYKNEKFISKNSAGVARLCNISTTFVFEGGTQWFYLFPVSNEKT
jgi:hypothetical protein